MAIRKRTNLTSVSVTMKLNDGTEVYLGSCENMSVTTNVSGTPVGQANTKEAVEIVDGAIRHTGSFERGQTDFDPHKKLINKDGENPYFTAVGFDKISGKSVRIKDAKLIGGIGVAWGLEGYGKDTIPFNALSVEYED